MNTIKYDGKEYLELQSKDLSQYAFPDKQILTGNGIDIGPIEKNGLFLEQG